MMDLAAARRRMVDSQIRTADVTNLNLIAAFSTLERERFVPDESAELAYLDRDLVVADAPPRRLVKPMVLAKLIQAAEVEPGQHVLDVGCASGYSSALLARLGASVVALEQDPGLVRRATAILGELGIANVSVERGTLAEGWPAAAPYEVILLNGATEIEPRALGSQLRDGGRLVCILGRAPAGKAMLYRMADGVLTGRPIFDATAALLPGFAQPLTFAF